MELIASESSAELRLSMQHVSIHCSRVNNSLASLFPADMEDCGTHDKVESVMPGLTAALEDFTISL